MKQSIRNWVSGVILIMGIFSYFFWLPKSQESHTIDSKETSEASIRPRIIDGQQRKSSDHIKTIALSENGSKNSSHEEFSKRIFASIPTRQEIRDTLHNETHSSVSELTIRAGELIGLVEEKMETDPSFYLYGIHFFSDCVTHNDFSNSVRALCYSHLRRKAPEHPALLSSEIPQSIINAALGLAENLSR